MVYRLCIMTKETFKYLFDQYFDTIRSYLYYRSGNAELATDIAQDVFMKVWEKRARLNPKKIKPLLYKMASDQFVSHIRKNNSADKYLKQIEFLNSSENPESNYQFQELKSNYENALNELKEPNRSTFLMSRKEGLSYKEIAERLDVSVKAIEKRMSKTLSFLRNKLIHNE